MRLKERWRDEDGFGLIELMVASGIMLVTLVGMAYLATSAFKAVAVARQRHAATGLLDRSMEQIRALPYDTIKLGLRTSDLVGDSAVSGAGTVASPYRLVATNERIPNGANGTVTPLVPNVTTTTVGTTAYTAKAYITYFNDDTASGAYRATVAVTWTTALGNPGTRRISNQTIIYSPAGCLSTAAHPFSAPCQAFSYASASTQAGQIDTSNSLLGGTLARASLDLGGTSSSMQLEQLSSVQSDATGPGLTLSVAGSESTLHHAKASTQSDNDPASPGAVPYQTATASTLPLGTLTTTLGGNLLTLSVGANDTASSTSTVAASATNSCLNHAGAAQLDGQPCGRGTAQQLGAMSATLGLSGIGLGLTSIAEVLAAPTQSLSHTNRDLTASTYCAGTSGNGCVHAHATRSIGRVRLGGLPLGLSPSGAWAGYLIELTGYTDTVTAEAGINAAAPTATRTGTLKYWNGTGYTTRDVSLLTTGESINVASVVIDVALLRVSLGVTLAAGGSSSTSTTATCTGGSACRTSADAKVDSPLIASVSLRIDALSVPAVCLPIVGCTPAVLGPNVLNLATNVDLGSSVAKANYSDAPTS
jgi:hypothetical protein